MKKVYLLNNYIIVEIENDKSPFSLTQSFFDYRGQDSFIIKSGISDDILTIGDVIDENDVAYTYTSLEAFLTENTSVKSSGNGTATLPVRPPSGVSTSIIATTNGVIAAGKKTISMMYLGKNGTLNSSVRPNGFIFNTSYPNGEDLPAFTYTVPTTGDASIIIEILE
jgi:hypothetical protein